MPPHFRVGKQPFNSIVLVMCGKQLCRGVKNKNVQVQNTKTLSFSLLNSLPEQKVKITYCYGCVFVFHSFFQTELTDKNLGISPDSFQICRTNATKILLQ